ncbi:Putative zinc-finger [Streptosporangium subroseum]|uniref:Putative zinc-finger n=1 Tax=Streptosporangium subroseum TaxID=106412 RepID=A0A239NVH3_9ACTN|nr:zf-HC2 domain-containing protein [Streptosporangium subroseum]SNT58911.1 Putative zinc-finger [Streptosporangium subroseum]
MMMTCDEVRMSLGAYVLGALEPDECVLVEAHLAECADCQAEFDELTGVSAFLGKVSESDVAQVGRPPRAVLDRLLSAKVKRRRMTRLMLSLAASVLVVGLGGGIWAANRPANETATTASASRSAPAAGDSSSAAQGKSVPAPASSASETPTPEAKIMLDAPGEPGEESSRQGFAERKPGELKPGDLRVEGASVDGSVRATVTALAGTGGTKVKVVLSGVAEGTRCRLDVIGFGGNRERAGNWIVDRVAYDESDGFATTTMRPQDISRFEIATTAGRVLLSVPAR